jgi:N-formylglutamate amidohydrolase
LMTDHFTDQLFTPLVNLGAVAIVNRVSRLIMDPERFPDDADEGMAVRHGMGAVYLKGCDGQRLRRPDFRDQDREAIMQAYYWPYARALEALVTVNLPGFSGDCFT